MDIISARENNENTTKCSKIRQLENITRNDNNAIEETFFKILCSSRGNRNYRHLKQLLLLYTQNVLSSVESNVKFDPINLKNNINNILIFFHLYWLDIKQEIADHSLYLNKMSALLSICIDMELKTSREEIDVKILPALCIYLNNSEEHIIRVLLRIKHMTKKYTKKICNHIFTYVKERRGLESLKKITKESIIKKPGKIEIIDLTKDDESVSYKETSKKIKHNLQDQDCLKTKKDTVKNKKRKNKKGKIKKSVVELLKHSSGLMASVNIEKSSNGDSKSTVKKVCLEHKPFPNNKISDSTESYTSICNRSSLNNSLNNHINLQKSEHLNVIKNQMNNTCPEIVKEDEKLDNPLYSSTFHNHDQYIKGFNVTTNELKECKPENHHDVSHMTYMTGNAIDSYNNTIMQSKKTLTSHEENVKDIIPSLKICQNDNVDQHSFKHEIPINTNCNATQKSCKYCESMPVGKPIICMICNRLYNNEHIYVVCRHRIDDISVIICRDMHGEIKVQHLDKSNDNTVSTTTFTEDQMIESSLYNQHVNFDNVKMNDNDIAKYSEKRNNSNDMYTVSTTFMEDQIVHGSKYSENIIKTEQERNDCDTLNETNDRLHLFERDIFNIDMDSTDMDSKLDFKTSIDMDDSISFSHQITILETLENVSNETTEFLLSPKQDIILSPKQDKYIFK